MKGQDIMTNEEMTQLAINTIRTLSIDAVQQAKSDHPGTLMAPCQRYVVNPIPSQHEIWSLRHPIRVMPPGKILRIIVRAEATVVWTMDGWKQTNHSEGNYLDGLNLWFVDLPTAELAGKSQVEFTFSWIRPAMGRAQLSCPSHRESPWRTICPNAATRNL